MNIRTLLMAALIAGAGALAGPALALDPLAVPSLDLMVKAEVVGMEGAQPDFAVLEISRAGYDGLPLAEPDALILAALLPAESDALALSHESGRRFDPAGAVQPSFDFVIPPRPPLRL